MKFYKEIDSTQKSHLMADTRNRSLHVIQEHVDDKSLERLRRKPYEARDIYGKEK